MKLIALTIILMLTTGIAGYTIGNVQSKNSPLSQLTQNIKPQDKNNSIFQSQTASITGTIVSVSGKTINVKSDNNQTGQFMASDRLIVLSLGKPSSPASPSAGIAAIELNKIALIQLEMEGGEYKIVSIAYVPANNAPPPPVR